MRLKALALVFILSVFLFTVLSKKPELCIYDWYGVLSPDILKQFEKETGISVTYDVYDSNEMLETKLISGNCKYDLIFPSAFPYAYRHIKLGLYQKIDKLQLKNHKDLDSFLINEIKKIDPEYEYLIPYYWGTIGFAYNEDIIDKLYKNAPKDSWRMLFDEEIVSKFSSYGISFLEESIDIFPIIAKVFKCQNAKEIFEKLKKIRSKIKRFGGGRFMNDLLMEDICIAQAWSGEANKSVKDSKNIKYVIPIEGSQLWIDCIAIPKFAINPKNAHKFIDFMLRPDISAQITASTLMPTIVLGSKQYLNPSILMDKNIFPEKENLFLNVNSMEEESLYWIKFRYAS